MGRYICSSTAQVCGSTSVICANRRGNRAWRQLHLAVDAKSGKIVASELTNHRIRDSTPVPTLLEQTDHPLASLRADGTCDRKGDG